MTSQSGGGASLPAMHEDPPGTVILAGNLEVSGSVDAAILTAVTIDDSSLAITGTATGVNGYGVVGIASGESGFGIQASASGQHGAGLRAAGIGQAAAILLEGTIRIDFPETHTLGAYTGYAHPIVDSNGSIYGYIPIYSVTD